MLFILTKSSKQTDELLPLSYIFSTLVRPWRTWWQWWWIWTCVWLCNVVCMFIFNVLLICCYWHLEGLLFNPSTSGNPWMHPWSALCWSALACVLVQHHGCWCSGATTQWALYLLYIDLYLSYKRFLKYGNFGSEHTYDLWIIMQKNGLSRWRYLFTRCMCHQVLCHTGCVLCISQSQKDN